MGEYGARSHSKPVVEELVRVPTVFVSSSEDLDNKIDRSIMSHVDVAATVEDALGMELPWETSGTSVFADGPGWGYNEYNIPSRSTPTAKDDSRMYEIAVRSVWDLSGGHVFKHVEYESPRADLTGPPSYDSYLSRLRHLILVCGRFMPVIGSDYASLSELIDAIKYHSKQEVQFGLPAISRENAASIVNNIVSKASQDEDRVSEVEISDSKLDHLADLGYR